MKYETQDIHKIFNVKLSGDGEDILDHSIRCGVSGTKEKREEKRFLTSQYALVYLSEGSGTYQTGEGKEWSLKPGCLFQRYPDKPHRVVLSGGHRKYYLAVPSQVYEMLEKAEHPFIRRPVHYPGKDRGVAGEYEKLLLLFTEWDGAEYFSLLVEMQSTLDRIIKIVGTDGKGVRERLERAADLLRNDTRGKLSLEEVARRVDMGYHHFRKAFARQYAMPPGQYRTEGRIRAAMGLLMTADISVSRIAAELGYGDLYMFSSQFKKVTGLSPSRFRSSLSEDRR